MVTEKQSEALDHLMRAHYGPAFVKACAARGLQIEDEVQLRELLETTAQIKAAQQQTNGQRELTSNASHALNVAMYGEQEATKIAQTRAQEMSSSGAEPQEPGQVPEETKQALAALRARAAAE